jgi:DNA-binding beta-propeller fold protein YncE
LTYEFVEKDIQLTENVKNVIKIEKGDVSFGTINPQTNTIYLAYRDLNLILAVNINTKVTTKIPIFKPKYIQVNPETNMVYVIANGAVAVIDGKTNEKAREIQENAPFARFLSVNPVKNLLYVTYNNASDKSRKKNPIDRVVVYDGSTFSKIKETYQGLRQPEGLAVDPQSNQIFIANSKISTISVLDGDSHTVIDQIEIPREKLGWLSSSWQRLDNIIMINAKTRFLYVVGTVGSSDAGGGGERFCLFVVYINEKQLIKRVTLDGSATDVCSSIGINPQSNSLYIRKPSKNAILIMDDFAETNRKSVELIKMGFLKKIFSEKPDPIIVNPDTNKVYQTEGKLGLLLEMDG